MRSALPVVAPLERALYLRSLDLFRDLPAREIAVLAQLMREDWVRRGTVLHAAGERVEQIHLLVEGRVHCHTAGAPVRDVEAPAGVGLVELLADQPSGTAVVAATNLLALVIDAASFLDVLEEHFSIVLHLRAAFGREIATLRGEGDAVVELRRDAARTAVQSADLVQDLIWLRRMPHLGELGVGVLGTLLRERREIRLRRGDELWEQGGEAEFLVLVRDGTLVCGGSRAGTGAVLGLDEALTGTTHPCAAKAETDVVALAVDVRTLLDVAEDHFHVATGMLEYCARRLLGLRAESTSPRKEAAA